MKNLIETYKIKLTNVLKTPSFSKDVNNLYLEILDVWKNNKNIYICGNGGSAGNATHIANDFIYGAGIKNKKGLRIESLSANSAVITCLANDLGYEYIYSEQIKVKANKNDLLIVLSGSGNSKNVVNALKVANKLKMKTIAIVGFKGGKCLKMAKKTVHFKINDMQICEDLQLVVMHMCMQKLSKIKLK
jgi:D-sedoheptulose 7-phosphate isomerase